MFNLNDRSLSVQRVLWSISTYLRDKLSQVLEKACVHMHIFFREGLSKSSEFMKASMPWTYINTGLRTYEEFFFWILDEMGKIRTIVRAFSPK